MSLATSGQIRGRAGPPGWWRVTGRLLSPVSEGVVLLARLLPGGRDLSAATGDLLRGRRSLVGPSRACHGEKGTAIRPGVFSEYDLCLRMNLEPDREELDAAYLRRCGPKADLTILLRSLWVLALDAGAGASLQARPADHFNLFGVIVNNSDTAGILGTIRSLTLSHPNLLVQMLPDGPAESAPPAHVTFVNANNFNLALERDEYMRVLRRAELVLPDGIGIKLALQMAGGRLRKNLNGTDLMPHLAQLMVDEDWPVFLLGASDTVLAKAKANLERQQPALRIVGMRDGYFKVEDEEGLCAAINNSGAMVLIIGMGTPRQELWVARNSGRLRVPLILSMGGLLDFLGEKNRRAPLWMRQAGLEWVFRLVQEPGRMWKRYIVGNPVFLWRVRSWIRRRATTFPRKGQKR